MILCDGGCDVLSEKHRILNYTAPDIIKAYFKNNKVIDFVVILYVDEQTRGAFGDRSVWTLKYSMYINRDHKNTLLELITKLMYGTFSNVPSPCLFR